jgi:mRNA interferase MazF
MQTRRILKIKIPFIDTNHNKPRPVLELSSPSDEHNNFQVAYITSKEPEKNYLTDILIDSNHSDFEMTGLIKTSYIRLSKIFTIDVSMVDLVIGDLPADLNQTLNQILITHFKL